MSSQTIYQSSHLPRIHGKAIFPGLSRIHRHKPRFCAIPSTCHTTRALPRSTSASGFRTSGLPTPVSTGVPTGARNLGVLVSLPHLCYRLTPLASVSIPFPFLDPIFSRTPVSTFASPTYSHGTTVSVTIRLIEIPCLETSFSLSLPRFASFHNPSHFKHTTNRVPFLLLVVTRV